MAAVHSLKLNRRFRIAADFGAWLKDRGKLTPGSLQREIKGEITNLYSVYGSKPVDAELSRLRKVWRELVNEAPSWTWARHAFYDGVEFPPGGAEKPTPGAVRMVMCVVSGRYTPPQCLGGFDGEDTLDGMTEQQAEDYDYPSSCGSVVCWKNV